MSIRFPEINISQCMYAFANTVTNPPVDYASGDPWYGCGGWVQLGVGRLSPRERVGLFNYALSQALNDLNRSEQR